jgi:hypothetical protein
MSHHAGMNRAERRAAASEMRSTAKAWPDRLVEIPPEEWQHFRTPARPVAVWRSRHYLVQRYDAAALGGVEVRRLSINRVTMGSSGYWDQDIPWEDLQRCKRESGHGDWYGVEIYPRDRDIVNVANMRHLWLMAEPLELGWFSEGPTKKP